MHERIEWMNGAGETCMELEEVWLADTRGVWRISDVAVLDTDVTVEGMLLDVLLVDGTDGSTVIRRDVVVGGDAE